MSFCSAEKIGIMPKCVLGIRNVSSLQYLSILVNLMLEKASLMLISQCLIFTNDRSTQSIINPFFINKKVLLCTTFFKHLFIKQNILYIHLITVIVCTIIFFMSWALLNHRMYEYMDRCPDRHYLCRTN